MLITADVELKAGAIVVTNTDTKPHTVQVYVPNKENVPVVLGAGNKITVTAVNAGEAFTYFAQATDKITVAYSA